MIKRPKQREKSNSGDHYISGFQIFLTAARSKKYILQGIQLTNAVCVCVCIQVQREFTGQRIVLFIFFYFKYVFKIFILYWIIVDLQCVSFKCTTKWFSYTYIHVSILFQILSPLKLLQNIEYSSLCYTVGPCWLSVLYIVVCTRKSQTLSLSLPSLFPYRFLQNIEYSSLCYTVGPCWLSIFYIVVCIC